jgi:hypothetical protein
MSRIRESGKYRHWAHAAPVCLAKADNETALGRDMNVAVKKKQEKRKASSNLKSYIELQMNVAAMKKTRRKKSSLKT